jgi:hydroxymethylpyrimidine pyrophosphatase-like HAD family hydrolase
MIIALDFDGTVVNHIYPEIGYILPNFLHTIKRIVEKKHKIILYTMRDGIELDDAVNYLKNLNIPLYGINRNLTQNNWTGSPKVYANLYIDDAALGTPLDINGNVDWYKIEKILEEKNII